MRIWDLPPDTTKPAGYLGFAMLCASYVVTLIMPSEMVSFCGL